MPENADLSAKQEQFILAYLASGNVQISALTCKINEATGYRWLKQPKVQAALKQAQKALFESELSELRRIVGKAIRTLDRNMSSEDAPPSTQVAAARIVLEQAITIYKTAELEERLQELEAMLGKVGVHGQKR